MNRWLLFRNTQGFACVTPELALRVPPKDGRAKVVCVTNGISLSSGEPLPAASNRRPRLVFLAGAPEPWHGLDKISWLASELPEFDFDLVGPLWSPEVVMPDNVRIHGFLERDAYEPLLASADVGLAGLALHRIGRQPQSPLKVREYLLRGIPVIVGYEDPDLEGEPWFVLAVAEHREQCARCSRGDSRICDLGRRKTRRTRGGPTADRHCREGAGAVELSEGRLRELEPGHPHRVWGASRIGRASSRHARR